MYSFEYSTKFTMADTLSVLGLTMKFPTVKFTHGKLTFRVKTYPPPLRKHGRSRKSQVKTAVERLPCA